MNANLPVSAAVQLSPASSTTAGKTFGKAFWRWLVLVMAVAVLVRAGLWLAYPLAESNDTPTYRHLSNSLRNRGFERYNGMRTPGYPFLLMLTRSDSVTYAAQLTLGALTTLLVFYIAWGLTRRAWFAGLMGLAHTLNLGQLFFEASLLTESLATFLLFVVLAGLVFIWEMENRDTGNIGKQVTKHMGTPPFTFSLGSLPSSLGAGFGTSFPVSLLPCLLLYTLIGLAAAALAMVRPLFAPIALWGAFFLVFFWRSATWKTRWLAAILTALPLVITLAVWMNFIYVRFKIVGLDSMGGYHLVNHVSSFFERAPEEYADIRDTFLEFRATRMRRTGAAVNTIWDAIPTLMEQEKRNYYGLARVMGTISQRLITENPDLYAKNLVLGWWWFWRVGVFWLPQTIEPAMLRPALTSLMLLQRMALFGVNMLFLAGSLALLWPKIRARLNPPLFIWFAASSVWVISILQTLAEHGDNARFLAPMQTLVVIVVGWGITRLVSRS